MKKYLSYFFLIDAFLFSGCTKYLDINTDPNLVYNPPINSLLVSSTYQTGVNVFRMGNITSYYVQYLASPSTGSDRDTYKEEDLSGTWSAHYDVMTDIKQMMDLGISTGATEHVGVGKILLAWNLNMLINMFGDVPYSQAFKGKENLTPSYDNQQALHDTTVKLLNEGITELAKPAPLRRLDAGSDLIHRGSIAAWIKTANALKARFLNQLSKRTDKYKPAEILTTLASAYTSNTDNAALTTFPGNSPWNQVARDNANLLLNGWLSEQFVDALNGKTFIGVTDPRLPLITNLTKFGDYRGTPNGKGRVGTGTSNEESVLTTSGFYSKSGASLWLVTFAEMKFIEAEAAFRSGDRTRAYSAYLAGIRAHMDMMGVSATARDTYIALSTVSVGANALTLDLIFKEKYVAMFLHPEAWVDARRYDYKYKDFTLPVNAALNEFIRRAAYPTIEISRNNANIPQVTLVTRLWWDQ